MNKLVKESLYEFSRSTDPKSVLGIGRIAEIREFFRSLDISDNEYIFREDGKIYFPAEVHIRGIIKTKLPNGLVFSNDVYLNDNYLTELPNDIIFNRSVWLNNNPLTKLPDNLTIGYNLILCDTAIKTLPNKLKVYGDLNIMRTDIIELPDDLIVKEKIYVDPVSYYRFTATKFKNKIY